MALPWGAGAVPWGSGVGEGCTAAVPWGTGIVPWDGTAVPWGTAAVPYGTDQRDRCSRSVAVARMRAIRASGSIAGIPQALRSSTKAAICSR